MIRINSVSTRAVGEIRLNLGQRAINHVDNDHEGYSITLNENAEIKFYNFDSGVTIQLGANKYLLNKTDYWRIELE